MHLYGSVSFEERLRGECERLNWSQERFCCKYSYYAVFARWTPGGSLVTAHYDDLVRSAVIVLGVLVLQQLCSQETLSQMMGRVSATANGLQTVFQLSAPVLGALIATFFGVGFLFAVAGGVLVLLGILLLLLRLQSRMSQAGAPEETAGMKTEMV